MIWTNNSRCRSLTLVHTQVCSEEMVVADEAMKSFSAEPLDACLWVSPDRTGPP